MAETGPRACACRKSNPNILVMQPAQDWKAKEYALPSEPCAIGAHPCPTIGACASHYSSSCKPAARDEDAARRRQQHGPGIPAGSNRSAVQHMRFAMASAATSVDHECPWTELFE